MQISTGIHLQLGLRPGKATVRFRAMAKVRARAEPRVGPEQRLK